ncbi:MAG: hypothetical protein LC790_18290, partial [Actinobacteria bacterium]|nr:hypothetical protein [Actinomycetota bacterium]
PTAVLGAGVRRMLHIEDSSPFRDRPDSVGVPKREVIFRFDLDAAALRRDRHKPPACGRVPWLL